MEDNPESDIIHRQLDVDGEKPAIQVANIVAEIEGTDATEIPTMWDCIDGMLDHLFSTPPDPEAQMEVEFSFWTCRITVEQDGTATFVKTE